MNEKKLITIKKNREKKQREKAKNSAGWSITIKGATEKSSKEKIIKKLVVPTSFCVAVWLEIIIPNLHTSTN